MRNKITCLVLALASTSCAYKHWNRGETAHVFVDKKFSDAQVASIHRATDAWEKALDGYVQFDYVLSADYDDLITVEADAEADIEREHGDTNAAITHVDWSRDGGTIHLPDDIDQSTFDWLALHEMGHAIGLVHTGPGTLMDHFIYEASQSITCDDVEQFCSNNECDVDESPTCVMKHAQPL